MDSRFDPRPVASATSRLRETPELGRSAVLLAELPVLAHNRSDAAARLLADLVLGRIPGVPRDTLLAVTRVVPPDVCVRAYGLARPARSFATSLLFARFSLRDVRPHLEAVRDGVSDSNDHMFTDGLIRLGFELATGRLRDTVEPLHRKDGVETLFLFGASNAPEHLLRELHIVSYHPGPSAVYDLDMARWSLSSPHHTPRSRGYAVSLLAAPVLAALSAEGAVSVRDVAAWIIPRTKVPFDPQLMLALTDVSAPAMRTLRSRIFALTGDMFPYVAVLSPSQRALVLRERYGPLPTSVLEFVDHLVPKWRRDLDDLLATAHRLDRASHSAARRNP